MLPNSQDTTLVKTIKVCGIFVFPFIILALLIAILVIPAPKRTGTIEGRVVASTSASSTPLIVAYLKGTKTVVSQLRPPVAGSYRFTLPAGTYTLALPEKSAGVSAELPRDFTLSKNQTIVLDIHIR